MYQAHAHTDIHIHRQTVHHPTLNILHLQWLRDFINLPQLINLSFVNGYNIYITLFALQYPYVFNEHCSLYAAFVWVFWNSKEPFDTFVMVFAEINSVVLCYICRAIHTSSWGENKLIWHVPHESNAHLFSNNVFTPNC